MTKDEALKQALEALELEDMACRYEKDPTPEHIAKAIAAIKEVLAQPEYNTTSDPCLMENAQGDLERINLVQTGVGIGKPAQQQEPVAWMYQDKSTHEVRFQKHMKDFVDHSKTSEVPLYSEPLANHELQCVCGAVWCGDEMVHLPNKTTPPQRKPLSNQKIIEMYNEPRSDAEMIEFARAIEAAHGIWPENSDCYGPDWTDRDGEYLK